KCDPDLALDLRDRYEQVHPGYHMNKKHWNTVEIEGGIREAELRKMIDHSYDLVVQSLPRASRAKIPHVAAPRRPVAVKRRGRCGETDRPRRLAPPPTFRRKSMW